MHTLISTLSETNFTPAVLLILFMLAGAVATAALQRAMRPAAGPLWTNSEAPMILAFGLMAVDGFLLTRL
jgi:hypothetical protein